jgi:hypothetical protein
MRPDEAFISRRVLAPVRLVPGRCECNTDWPGRQTSFWGQVRNAGGAYHVPCTMGYVFFEVRTWYTGARREARWAEGDEVRSGPSTSPCHTPAGRSFVVNVRPTCIRWALPGGDLAYIYYTMKSGFRQPRLWRIWERLQRMENTTNEEHEDREDRWRVLGLGGSLFPDSASKPVAEWVCWGVDGMWARSRRSSVARNQPGQQPPTAVRKRRAAFGHPTPQWGSRTTSFQDTCSNTDMG